MPPLPFDRVAAVVEQGGDPVAGAEAIAVACRSMRSPRETNRGEVYDWTGEAEAKAAPFLVDAVNRSLVLDDGLTLKLVGAVAHDFLPHVELTLRQMKQGG